jgi:hypothetical protein
VRTALDLIEREATKLRERQPGLTREATAVKAMAEHPAWYGQYLDEERARQRQASGGRETDPILLAHDRATIEGRARALRLADPSLTVEAATNRAYKDLPAVAARLL